LINSLQLRSQKTGIPITHVCEVGVKQGKYAEYILKNIPSIERIYLVDVWAHQSNYKDHANVSQSKQDQFLQDTIQRMEPWLDKVTILRGLSVDMASDIPDGSLDWVYIDARHDYIGCRQDIESYWPKVKSAGVMSGHDYLHAHEVPGQDWSLCSDGTVHPGSVKGAVDDFANLHNKQVLVSYREKMFSSWSIIK
jgi:hypothetical protein